MDRVGGIMRSPLQALLVAGAMLGLIGLAPGTGATHDREAFCDASAAVIAGRPIGSANPLSCTVSVPCVSLNGEGACNYVHRSSAWSGSVPLGPFQPSAGLVHARSSLTPASDPGCVYVGFCTWLTIITNVPLGDTVTVTCIMGSLSNGPGEQTLTCALVRID